MWVNCSELYCSWMLGGKSWILHHRLTHNMQIQLVEVLFINNIMHINEIKAAVGVKLDSVNITVSIQLLTSCWHSEFSCFPIMICDMIYLSTAVGLTHSDSSTVHIYIQTNRTERTNNRTTQITTNLEGCRPCPVFASFTLAFALQLRKKHGKTSGRVAKEC